MPPHPSEGSPRVEPSAASRRARRPRSLRARRPAESRERVIGRGLAWLARWCWRWVGIALGAVILGWLIGVAWVVVLPVVLALIFTALAHPLTVLLRRRLRLPDALAALLVLLLGCLLLVAAGFAVGPAVGSQWSGIIHDATTGLQRLQDWVQRQNFISEDEVSALLQEAQARVTASADQIASAVLAGVSAAGSAVVTALMTLVLTFFFLKDGHRFQPWVRGVAGNRAGHHLDTVLGEAWSTLGGFIRTQAIVSFVDAVFIGVALVLVGVPLAVPLAVVTFFGGFVPIVGAFATGGLAVLVALVSVGAQEALVVLAAIVAVQQLESNVLSPWLQSKSMNLHPAVVLLSVALGGTLFGIGGAFLAVPVVAVVAVVLRYLDRHVAREVSAAGRKA